MLPIQYVHIDFFALLTDSARVLVQLPGKPSFPNLDIDLR